jgi:hypothetical protein
MFRTACTALLLMSCLAGPALGAGEPPPRRLFVSGHSLVDEPLPSNLELIASSLGHRLLWDRQYVVGSSIRARTRGESEAGWDGYRRGLNRRGEGMNVIAELALPAEERATPYDTLLITEQHALIDAMLGSDTARLLRHFHERLVAANPAGRTWFYEPWLDVSDKSNPQRWIAYERSASPAWQCIVARINVSLAAEGRPDRIRSVPAGAALAALVERATAGAGVPGVSAPTVRATVERVFSDDVHLTELGSYYVSLVVYAHLFGRSPVGAAHPPNVDAVAAASLQRTAWEFVQAQRSASDTTPAQCLQLFQSSFVAAYWSYVRDALWRRQVSAPRAWWRWLKHRTMTHWRLRSSAPDNPFRYDPAADRTWWLPAPP